MAPPFIILVGIHTFLAGCDGAAPSTSPTVEEPVTEAWVARYNGPNNSTDWASALAVDEGGSVYVVGYSEGSGAHEDYATVKYRPDGSEQWVARYNGPGDNYDQAYALGLDAAGNVYVTGYSWGSGTHYDCATVKYGPDGSEQWVARYNGSSNGDDKARTLAVDQAGNVYIAGPSESSGTAEDLATIKYGPGGNQEWVARYSVAGSSEIEAGGLATDGEGNVYVTGYSGGSGTDEDYVTIKYGPDGSQQWVARYNGPGNGADAASAVAVDGSGSVYVTGSSTGSGSYEDYATVKYGPDGSEQWVARYDGPENGADGALALTADEAGNVYVTGSSTGSGSHEDYATIKYSPDGSQQWVARYNGPGNGTDGAWALALDGAGNVYVAGSSHVSDDDADFATVKYGPGGSQLWEARYSGPGNGVAVALALAVDGAGNVYVTGPSFVSISSTGYNYDYVTIKYVQGSITRVATYFHVYANADSTLNSPRNGAVAMQDVLSVLAQVGLSWAGPP